MHYSRDKFHLIFFISPASVTVSLTVGTASTLCATYSSPNQPFGRCELAVDSSAFSSGASTLTVSVSLSISSILIQSTELGSVNLAPVPYTSTPTSVGLYFYLPVNEVVIGDTISVEMWAQTGNSATMESWGASLVYDTTLLSYQRVSHPSYTTVLTSQGVPNALNITGSGGTGNISGFFLAATLYFSVTSVTVGSPSITISMPAILNNAM